jgi:hypothetical protein
MSVRLLPAAQAELDEAIYWYAQQAPGLGDSFLVEFFLRRAADRAPSARLASTFKTHPPLPTAQVSLWCRLQP